MTECTPHTTVHTGLVYGGSIMKAVSLNQRLLFCWKAIRSAKPLLSLLKTIIVQSFLICETCAVFLHLVSYKYYDLGWLLRFINSWLRRPPQVRTSSFFRCLPYLLFRYLSLDILDFTVMCLLIRPHSLGIWFVFLSTEICSLASFTAYLTIYQLATC